MIPLNRYFMGPAPIHTPWQPGDYRVGGSVERAWGYGLEGLWHAQTRLKALGPTPTRADPPSRSRFSSWDCC